MDATLIQSLVSLGGVPFIAALVQMMKPFVSDGRWYAPIAIGFGLIINFGAFWALGSTDFRTGVVAATIGGVIAGLAASGLYSITQVNKIDAPVTPTPVPDVPAATGTPKPPSVK